MCSSDLIGELRAAGTAALAAEPAVALDYLDFADDLTLAELPVSGLVDDAPSGRILVSIAATVDGVRLLDAATLRARS